jgi:hypothetical protein
MDWSVADKIAYAGLLIWLVTVIFIYLWVTLGKKK